MIYLHLHKVNLLLLWYLQMMICLATSTLPAPEIRLAPGMIFEGESSAPIIPEEVQTISEKETIQKYRSTFPHLNTQQFRIRRTPKNELGMLLDSVEWKKIQINSLERNFSLMKKDLKNLRSEAWNKFKNQNHENSHTILKKFDELNYIHKLLGYHIRDKISSLISPETGSSIFPMKHLAKYLKSLMAERLITSADKNAETDSMINSLNVLLMESNYLSRRYILFPQKNKTTLKLQRIIFQTVDYMFQHCLISPRQFRYFFQMPKTLKLAARNMVSTFELRYGRELFYPKFPRPQFILHNPYSSHFWGLFQVLDEKEKLLFSYFSLKSLLIYNQTYKELRADDVVISVLKCESLFNTWENQIGTSQLTEKKQEMSLDEILNHTSMMEALQKARKHFMKPKKKYRKQEIKIICFLYLDFITENFGKYAASHQVKPNFHKTFSLVSRNFQFLEELSSIHQYVDQLRDPSFTLKLKPKSPREYLKEVRLIKRYLKIIFKKHHQFTNNIMNDDQIEEIYSQAGQINLTNYELMRSISLTEKKLQDDEDLQVIHSLQKENYIFKSFHCGLLSFFPHARNFVH
ncbi:hypothetical protein PGT21_030115 [Puccinia graminis f. sp. tritici]|uniref:Uncharacterized protein n=3 Tax=Puccinia graminis f. sp. tritici TaxID=56615 RepID=A0A5B0QBX0_PUCGR|nr:hypothetical protein PGT21_030115 [Puccinia graminis f. sp. tritici]